VSSEPLDVALEVIEVLEDLEIPYHVGGSFASSIHGVPRQTRDIDLVVELKLAHVPLLVGRLGSAFYIEAEQIRSAIRRQGSFNLVHLASGFKIDCFCLGSEAFDRSEFRRHRPESLGERTVFVKSAEDTLLRKLQWYRQGNEISDRQWNDILGILKTQRSELDLDYTKRWALELGVTDLLERALAAAGQ